MKKSLCKVVCSLFFLTPISFVQGGGCYDPTYYPDNLLRDITDTIPVINIAEKMGFQYIPNVAQYKNADWSHVVGVSHQVSLKEASFIANQDQAITYFFYMTGYQMVLETTDGDYRVFTNGDAVFFSGSPHWGEATGFSDGYVKISID